MEMRARQKAGPMTLPKDLLMHKAPGVRSIPRLDRKFRASKPLSFLVSDAKRWFAYFNCCETYSNHLLAGRFSEFEKNHPELVAIDSREQSTGAVMDFCELQEVFQILGRN